MNDFKDALYKKIKNSIKNEYGIENYDEYRYGTYSFDKSNQTGKKKLSAIKIVKNVVKKIIGFNRDNYTQIADNFVNNYLERINTIWPHLSQKDKDLFVDLIAYKILGYKKVKLPRNNADYWRAIATAKSLANLNDNYDPKFMHFLLHKFDLKSIGYDVKLYFSEIGIAINYVIEQYAYKLENKNIVSVEKGDIVLDIGGCWGDTALYFAEKSGLTGKVYSFEFIPENIKLFNINTSLNSHLINQIELIEQPVSNTSDETIYFKDFGPGSRVELLPFEGQTGTSSTISIDDFIKTKKIESVDFIKMDIEGAEISALNGAIETIKKFRPKLAIAIYHSFDDLVDIPNWILSLDLDYEIFIDHYTIHTEETICFARPKVYI